MAIEVHIDLGGSPVRVGTLHPAARGPAMAFEYERAWLARRDLAMMSEIAVTGVAGAIVLT